jgi:hypothetical protein
MGTAVSLKVMSNDEIDNPARRSSTPATTFVQD